MQIFLIHVFCAVKTHDVTCFVIDRESRNKILPQWCDAISFRSLVEAGPGLSTLSQIQPFQQIVLACGCAFVLVF